LLYSNRNDQDVDDAGRFIDALIKAGETYGIKTKDPL
jgi:hypothetical protein